MDQFLKKPNDFWPKAGNTFNDNVMASTRFIVYSSLIVFVLNRDNRVLLLGALVIAGIYLYLQLNPAPKQTDEDPMNNFSSRLYDADHVDKIMSRVFPDDTRNAQRNFFTMPDMDLEPFLLMQGRGQPYCRDDPCACTAEGNPHFPDEATRRAQYTGMQLF